MVRATRSRRSWARADRPRRSTALPSRPRARPSSPAARRAAAASSCAFGPACPRASACAPGRRDAGPHGRARLARLPVEDLVAGEARHVDVEVDPVEHRARQPRAVGLGATGRADAPADGVAVEAAGAGVPGTDQQRPRREAGAHHGPRDVDPALLEGLAEGVEGGGREGADLVEEEHPLMGEAHLPGPRQAAAADEAGGRDRVVGRAERPPRDQRAAGVEQPRHRVDAGDLDRLVQRERRQDAPAAAGRAWSCRRPGGPTMSIECPPAAATSSARRAAPCPRTSARSGPGARPPPASSAAASSRTSDGSARPSRRSTAARRVAGPRTSTPGHQGRLRRRCRGARPGAASRGAPRARPSRAPRAPAAATRRARARPRPPRPRAPPARAARRRRGWPARAARSYCGPGLAQVGRGEVGHDPPRGHGERLVGEPRAHALARLLDGRVRQPDHREGGQAGAQVDLHLDGGGLEAEDGGADEPGDHGDEAVTGRTRGSAPERAGSAPMVPRRRAPPSA